MIKQTTTNVLVVVDWVNQVWDKAIDADGLQASHDLKETALGKLHWNGIKKRKWATWAN